MATPYAQAMAREAERLAAAQKRNLEAAAGASSEAGDAKEDAWQSVFAASRSAVEASEIWTLLCSSKAVPARASCSC